MSQITIITDKDLEQIKDRAISEWKQINGENIVARAYFNSICVWLKEKGLLAVEEVPAYKHRSLSIDSCIEE